MRNNCLFEIILAIQQGESLVIYSVNVTKHTICNEVFIGISEFEVSIKLNAQRISNIIAVKFLPRYRFHLELLNIISSIMFIMSFSVKASFCRN